MKRRRYIPLSIRLRVALRQLAAVLECDAKDLQLDHDPALVLRPLNARKTDTTPSANSPDYLVYRPKESHKVKTHGPGGEKRITTRGSDLGEAARIKRLSRKEQEFRQRLLQPKAERPARVSCWPKRPMRKGSAWRG